MLRVMLYMLLVRLRCGVFRPLNQPSHRLKTDQFHVGHESHSTAEATSRFQDSFPLMIALDMAQNKQDIALHEPSQKNVHFLYQESKLTT